MDKVIDMYWTHDDTLHLILQGGVEVELKGAYVKSSKQIEGWNDENKTVPIGLEIPTPMPDR